MNLIWNVVKKDFRRFWLGAVLVLSIIALKFILATGVFGAEISREWMTRMVRFQNILFFAQWIISFVVALAVVHEDPVSEAGAFWETLPLTRRQLLAAKGLGILLLTVLPVLLAVVVGWCAFGLPWAALGWPLAVTLQAQLFFALLAMALASLTRNFAHVIYWLVGAIVVLMIPAIFPEAAIRVDGLPAPGARLTLATFYLVVLILTCLGVALSQFLGRSRRRSILAACVGVGLTALVPFLPPSWDAYSQFSSRQQEINAAVTALPVKVSSASINSLKPDAEPATLVRLAIDDRAAPFLLSIQGYFGRWWPEGAKPVSAWAKVYQANDRASKRAATRASGFGDTLVPPEVTLGLENQLPPADAARLPGRLTAYEGQVEIGARSVTMEGEMDLIAGTSLRTESGSSRITRVEKAEPVIRVDFDARDSGMFADRGEFLGVNALTAPVSRFDYVLVNREARRVVTGARTSAGISVYAYGAWLSRGRIEFVLSATDGPPDLSKWKLARVRFGPLERAVRSFRQDVKLEEVSSLERDPTWLQ